MSGTSQNSARNFAWPKQKKGICVNEGVVPEGQGQKAQQQHPLFLLGHLPQTAQLQCYRPPPIHVPYNHESGTLTSTVEQSKLRAMLLASKSSFQLNQPSSFWQADSFLHQQHLQAVAIQQLKVQPPTHQQLPSTLQLPASVPQQSSSALQSNLHHLMGDQQSHITSDRGNDHLSIQQQQQMLNNNSIFLHHQQWGSHSSISGKQQQQEPSLETTVQSCCHQLSLHQSVQKQSISQSLVESLPQYLDMQQNQNCKQLEMQKLKGSDTLISANKEQLKQFVQSKTGLSTSSPSILLDFTSQTITEGTVDWQEEVYQKMKSLKELYFAELNEIYLKVVTMFQQYDPSTLLENQSAQYNKLQRLKCYRAILEFVLRVLQSCKSSIPPDFKDKFPVFEREVVTIVALSKTKASTSQPTQVPLQQKFVSYDGEARSMTQQKMSLQHSTNSIKSNTGCMENRSVPLSKLLVPNAGKKMVNASQSGCPVDQVQENSFSSLQQEAIISKTHGDPDKPLPASSLLPNVRQIRYQQTGAWPEQVQAFAVDTPGILASSLIAEPLNPYKKFANLPTENAGGTSSMERSFERLINAVQSSSPRVLSYAASDIRSVVSMIDCMASPAPFYGSRAAGAVSFSKCHLQFGEIMLQKKRIKRNHDACAIISSGVVSVGSSGDRLACPSGIDASELNSVVSPSAKRQKFEVHDAILEEIRKINQLLIFTLVKKGDEDADSIAAKSEAGGTIIKCSFMTTDLCPSLKSRFALAQMCPNLSLTLLVPANYPKCSPVPLDNLLDTRSNESDDLSTMTKLKFRLFIRGLSEPVSLGEMVRAWDTCSRKVVTEYAEQFGGGSFSSRYSAWQVCTDARPLALSC